jgi:hypothetical protein
MKGEELTKWMQDLENDSSQVGSLEQGIAACRVVDIQEEMLSLVCSLQLIKSVKHVLTHLTGFPCCMRLRPYPGCCLLCEPI